MKSDKLKNLYFEFFTSKQHRVINSSSLIPENDPSVLFTTAGMQPLIPYLLGEKHPVGTRLVNIQKCLRMDDIAQVGDSSHLTFFQMLGNWSLGDYFKQTSIQWSYEFLFSPEWLGLNQDDFAFTVFEGDENCPADEESASAWRDLGIPLEKIFYLSAKDNWWGPAGKTGPCGPDTEIFIDTKKTACSPDCSPSCDCGKYLEVWNNVFMAYNKGIDGKLYPSKQKNVDTGMGLERILCVLNHASDVYETDLFAEIIQCLSQLSGKEYESDDKMTKAFRIVADHLRSAVFILGDPSGIWPSNTEQGYVLRRLIRRAIRYMKELGIPSGNCPAIAETIIKKYSGTYPELEINKDKILEQLKLEEERFTKTLEQGYKEFKKLVQNQRGTMLDGKTAFHLFDTFGFPIEFTIELASENNLTVDRDGYENCYTEHQQKSITGAGQKFACGLADQSQETARLHTATHLLQFALRKALDPDIQQKGSNITADRLRFDFNYERKLTPQEINIIENMVNQIINEDIPVVFKEMTLDSARVAGAIGLFDNKYDNNVKVYSIGESSKEICGGPHAKSTGELGTFKIIKEESCSSGIRRIKAILENRIQQKDIQSTDTVI